MRASSAFMMRASAEVFHIPVHLLVSRAVGTSMAVFNVFFRIRELLSDNRSVRVAKQVHIALRYSCPFVK